MSTISQAKTKNAKKKAFRPDTKFWTRVLVIILTLAMLAGTFYYILIFSVGNSRVNAASETGTEDLRFRVALIYGDDMTTDYRSRAGNGYTLGYNTGNDFTAVAATPVTEIRITLDKNLTFDSNERYQVAGKGDTVAVGAYHVLIEYGNADLQDRVSQLAAAFPEQNVFTGYLDGKNYIMLGQFSDSKAAELLAFDVREKLLPTETDPAETSPESGDAEPAADDKQFFEAIKNSSISVPSDTAITVIDPETHKLLWIFDDTTGNTYFGAQATQGEDEFFSINGFIGTNMFYYDDTIECCVRKKDSGDFGINVVNVLPLETYIMGVIPYEIGRNWPLETQKAFAIAVRCYALSGLGKHKGSANADLCNTSHCQVYKGFVSTNDRVRQAVEETKGMIAVYNGRICSTYHSTITGGCTTNVSQVWGGSQTTYGYLKAVATPWERYDYYSSGHWVRTATGQQIYENLVKKGYTGLKGAVTDIRILSLQDNSSYVYSIEFSDAAGNKQVITRSSKVSGALSPYVRSANFVVAKAGEKVTRLNFVKPGFGEVDSGKTDGVSIRTNPGSGLVYGRQSFSVITSGGIKSFIDSNEERVMTSGGLKSFTMSKSLDSNYYETILGVNGEVLPDILNTGSSAVTETITAEGNPGEFVFIGRGYGHGVGISQYGIKDLGDLGYDYETIFKAYYSNVEIISYNEYRNSK